MPATPETQNPETFITRWADSGAAERANAQTFLNELCDLLCVPRPDPTVADETANAYVFEKKLARLHHDGSQTTVSADLYKRACFMLETKQGASEASPPQGDHQPLSRVREQAAKYTAKRTGHGRRGTRGWDVAMERAFNQARNYVRYLRPEFQDPELPGHLGEMSLPKGAPKKKAATKPKKLPRPKTLPEQITAVRELLASADEPLDLKQIATRFTRANKPRLGDVLETLVSLGHAVDKEGAFVAA